jgi:hypothetical protein
MSRERSRGNRRGRRSERRRRRRRRERPLPPYPRCRYGEEMIFAVDSESRSVTTKKRLPAVDSTDRLRQRRRRKDTHTPRKIRSCIQASSIVALPPASRKLSTMVGRSRRLLSSHLDFPPPPRTFQRAVGGEDAFLEGAQKTLEPKGDRRRRVSICACVGFGSRRP